MNNFLKTTLDLILDLPAEPIIAGIIIALLLALPGVGIYAALRRRGKEPAMALVGLAVVANLLGMVVASGYTRSASMAVRNPNSTRPPTRRQGGLPPRMPRSPEEFRPEVLQSKHLASRIFRDADVNLDGLLSADEAAAAASAFVRSVAGEDRDSIDPATLRELLRVGLRYSEFGPGRPVEDVRRGESRKAEPRSPKAVREGFVGAER